MTAYVKVHKNYLGIVLAQLKKANGVRIRRGLNPNTDIQELCVESRLRADLTHILEQIDSMGYLLFSYKVCK